MAPATSPGADYRNFVSDNSVLLTARVQLAEQHRLNKLSHLPTGFLQWELGLMRKLVDLSIRCSSPTLRRNAAGFIERRDELMRELKERSL